MTNFHVNQIKSIKGKSKPTVSIEHSEKKRKDFTELIKLLKQLDSQSNFIIFFVNFCAGLKSKLSSFTSQYYKNLGKT